MTLPTYSMRQLLEAGVHFGHQSHRWNPKMSDFIFGTRNNIHIIDLAQSVPLLHQALVTVSDTVARGGRVLFVGTKRQASEPIAEAARNSAQYFINHRWLGGTLTNWGTISKRIKHLRQLEQTLETEAQGYTKKEALNLTRERDKLERSLGGIKDMGGVPNLLFVIDTNKEQIAIAEARKLNIPIIAIVDTNCDPDQIDYPIPGNDDAGRAITLYCDLISRAAIDGIERSQASSGVDIGASEAPPAEELPGEGDAPAGDAGAGVDMRMAWGGLDAPRGEADDLKKIEGLDAGDEQKLNAHGIYHLDQLAGLDEAGVTALDEALGEAKVAGGDWVAKAKALKGGSEAAA
ncbi:MAG: 30S ribosomal protein S2 [Pseudomonadota bacterium]